MLVRDKKDCIDVCEWGRGRNGRGRLGGKEEIHFSACKIKNVYKNLCDLLYNKPKLQVYIMLKNIIYRGYSTKSEFRFYGAT